MRAKPVGGAGREALVPAPKDRTSFPHPVSVEHKDRPCSESGAHFRRMSLLGLLMILPPRFKRHVRVVFFKDDEGTKYHSTAHRSDSFPGEIGKLGSTAQLRAQRPDEPDFRPSIKL